MFIIFLFGGGWGSGKEHIICKFTFKKKFCKKNYKFKFEKFLLKSKGFELATLCIRNLTAPTNWAIASTNELAEIKIMKCCRSDRIHKDSNNIRVFQNFIILGKIGSIQLSLYMKKFKL